MSSKLEEDRRARAAAIAEKKQKLERARQRRERGAASTTTRSSPSTARGMPAASPPAPRAAPRTSPSAATGASTASTATAAPATSAAARRAAGLRSPNTAGSASGTSRRATRSPAASVAPGGATAAAPGPVRTSVTLSPTSTRAAASEPLSADDLDNFIDDLLNEPRVGGGGGGGAATAAPPPAPAAVDPPAGPGPAGDAAGAGGRQVSASAAELSLVVGVAAAAVAAHEPEAYGKGTQTDLCGEDVAAALNMASGGGGAVPGAGAGAGALAGNADGGDAGAKQRSSSAGDDAAGAGAGVSGGGGGGDDDDNAAEGAAAAPKQLAPEEVAKVVESEPFRQFLSKSARHVERALAVAEEYDFLVDYGSVQQDAKGDDKADELLRDFATLTDEAHTHSRPVTDITWSPMHSELFAVSYGKLDTPGAAPTTMGSEGLVLVWSSVLRTSPEYVFTCQSPVLSVRFHDFLPNCLIGGTYSGRLVLWDMRAKTAPVQTSALSTEGHAHPVYSLSLVGSTSAHTLYSVSTDGRLCGWNTSSLTTPVSTHELACPTDGYRSTTVPVTATALSVPHGEAGSFVVASENGCLYSGEFEGRHAGIKAQFDAHKAPVTSLSHHPTSRRLMLSSSVDWTVQLWDLALRNKPLMAFTSHSDYIYDAQWSPTHPGMFATADGSGAVDVWNLSAETELPAFHKQVSSYALNRVRWSNDGRLLAAGDSSGVVSLLRSAPEVVTPRPDDASVFEDVVRRASLAAPPATM